MCKKVIQFNVVDPKLFITDPVPTSQLVSGPYPTFKKFRIRFRIRHFSLRNMIIKVLK
jgi:hypothetical protein